MAVVVVENGNGHYSVILAIIQLFSPLFSYSRYYSVVLAIKSVVLAFMSVVLALCFCTVFNYSILFYLLCVVQSAVYI